MLTRMACRCGGVLMLPVWPSAPVLCAGRPSLTSGSGVLPVRFVEVWGALGRELAWGEGADHARPCLATVPAHQYPPLPSCIPVHPKPWGPQPQQQSCAAGAASCLLFGPYCAPPVIGAAQKTFRQGLGLSSPGASQEHGRLKYWSFWAPYGI